MVCKYGYAVRNGVQAQSDCYKWCIHTLAGPRVDPTPASQVEEIHKTAAPPKKPKEPEYEDDFEEVYEEDDFEADAEDDEECAREGAAWSSQAPEAPSHNTLRTQFQNSAHLQTPYIPKTPKTL